VMVRAGLGLGLACSYANGISSFSSEQRTTLEAKYATCQYAIDAQELLDKKPTWQGLRRLYWERGCKCEDWLGLGLGLDHAGVVHSRLKKSELFIMHGWRGRAQMREE
jgi:hypothetical protein